MNRKCQGDYFSVNGKNYYRCLGDGSISETTSTEICPICLRTKDANYLDELKTRIRIVTQALHPIYGWIDLPKNIEIITD